MKINEYMVKCHANAVDKGFYEDLQALQILKENSVIDSKFYNVMFNNAVATRLSLVHSEVSEALEALRKENIENFEEEIADIAIRIFDLAGALDIDLEEAINQKMKKNQARNYKHDKLF